MSDTTRLSIAGVPSRVALRVADRSGHRATLEQRLPFLAIGTEIADDEGRTGRIARVAVTLEGGVPKIVLELAYDAVPLRASTPPTPSARPRRDETMSFERPTVPEPLRVPRRIDTDAGAEARPGMGSRPLALAFPLEKKKGPALRAPREIEHPPDPPRMSWLARLFG